MRYSTNCMFLHLNARDGYLGLHINSYPVDSCAIDDIKVIN